MAHPTPETGCPPLMIELFAGSARMAQTFREAGFETFTVDIEELSRDPERQIDLIADVLSLQAVDLPSNPHVVWASPPCTAYSFARAKDPAFGPGGVPLCEEAHAANRLVQHTLHLIDQLEPTYWFMENPQAHLASQPFMRYYMRRNVNYCQYGSLTQKPTHIWGKHPIHWIPKGHCHHTSHSSQITHPAQSGLWNNVIPKKNRALLPQPLCDEIVKAVIDSAGAYSVESLTEWI